MTDLEKLRVLLPHWIGHNEEHQAEFERWARSCQDAGGPGISAALIKAAEASEKVTNRLKEALLLAGGPMEQTDIHGHHGHGPDHHHRGERS